jgi:DNA-binding response OmpR family regulator
MATSKKPGLRLLCVGSDKALCKQLARKFKRLGNHITWAPTFAEALFQTLAVKYNHYLLVGTLPDGDCLELCKEIRQADKTTPIIFFTIEETPEIVKQSRRMGANTFFTKLDNFDF